MTVLATACDSPADPPAPVRLEPAARPLVENILVDASTAIWWAGRVSDPLDPPHLGFGGFLVGREGTRLVHISLATTDDGVYEESCGADTGGSTGGGFWAEHDFCARLRIQDGAHFVDAYYTEQPHRLAGDRHEMRYAATLGPGGTVRYENNPVVVWSYDFGDDGSVVVEAAVDTEVRVEADDGTGFTLDHHGVLRASLGPGTDVLAARVELAFPRLTACGKPLLAVVEDDGRVVNGAITCGSETVARITHPGDEFRFEWTDG